jgi:hypothetical protein
VCGSDADIISELSRQRGTPMLVFAPSVVATPGKNVRLSLVVSDPLVVNGPDLFLMA